MNRKRHYLVLCLLWVALPLMANNEGPDFFQRIGKIYVVVAVLVIIFLGLAFYLYRLDRRISQLEKKSQHE